MSGLEHATGRRQQTRTSPFRPEWGTPPVDERERAAWLRVNVAQHEIRNAGKRTTGAQAQARLLERAP
jgi:hypothetical protein